MVGFIIFNREMSEVEDLLETNQKFFDTPTTIVTQKTIFGFINLGEPADIILLIIILVSIVYLVYRFAAYRNQAAPIRHVEIPLTNVRSK